MKWQKQLSQSSYNLMCSAVKTNHGRIVLSGLSVGLCYLPTWSADLWIRAIQGSTGLVLISGVLVFGLRTLWKQRKQLAQLAASPEDQLLGHLLILSGVVLFPFCRFAFWSQALLWLLILIGIAISHWGVNFFIKYSLPASLIALSVYPRPGIAARILWEVTTPPYLLERFMAWSGTLALRAIGQPATHVGQFIYLPAGSVEVNWGCNGFNMAFAMAITGFLFGLFFRQSRVKIIALMVGGIILALILNIPRIMLVTLAAVYWGDKWFNFWHGSWGAQIFVGILFTVYYYIVMAIIKRKPTKASV